MLGVLSAETVVSNVRSEALAGLDALQRAATLNRPANPPLVTRHFELDTLVCS
jgi:hypothetical protein